MKHSRSNLSSLTPVFISAAVCLATLPALGARSVECSADPTLVVGVAQANGFRVHCAKKPPHDCQMIGAQAVAKNGAWGNSGRVDFLAKFLFNKELQKGWRISRVTTTGGNVEVLMLDQGRKGFIARYTSRKGGETKRFGVSKFYFRSPTGTCGPRGDGWREAFTGRSIGR